MATFFRRSLSKLLRQQSWNGSKSSRISAAATSVAVVAIAGAATTTLSLANPSNHNNGEEGHARPGTLNTPWPDWMHLLSSTTMNSMNAMKMTHCEEQATMDTPMSSDEEYTYPVGEQPLVLSKEPRLENHVAVITGASRGLGQAIAIQFVREGAKVVLVDIDGNADETLTKIDTLLKNSRSTTTKTVEEVAMFCQADISNKDQVEAAIQMAVAKFGPRIHVLINNACKFVFESVETAAVEDWETSMRVNILGHALVTQACLPYMKFATHERPVGYGPSIVFQGSISSFKGQPNCATYATMKGAIVQLARNCAYDLAKYNIRVNSLCAGTIETPISQTERTAHQWTFDEWERLKTQDVFLQRVGTAYEIAKAAVFLASTDASYTSGAHLMVDGGAAACTVMQR